MTADTDFSIERSGDAMNGSPNASMNDTMNDPMHDAMDYLAAEQGGMWMFVAATLVANALLLALI